MSMQLQSRNPAASSNDAHRIQTSFQSLPHRKSLPRSRNALGAASVATLFLACGNCLADTQVGAPLPPAPDILYGDLFVAVQTAQIFPDQKTFVDSTPTENPATIVQLYEAQKGQPGFSASEFREPVLHAAAGPEPHAATGTDPAPAY